jgi:DNA-binding transcriptional MerR regulator/methylmalonyl-CoA mutase cobalamin-binding subunit
MTDTRKTRPSAADGGGPGSARRAAERVSIAAVERDTGLSKDTLRVWERRYGFPNPGRDAFGERAYSRAQVEKLRVIKRLMDQGHRPGRIIDLSMEALHRLAQEAAGAAADADAAMSAQAREDLRPYLDQVKAHRVEELRRQFAQGLLRLGLARFVTDVVAPLNDRVGDAWTRGEFEIFEEHLYTEAVQVVLRNAINGIPQAQGRPNVLLTTLPQESHGLGILMVEAILSLEGCRCVSLGVQTPVWDIVLAADAQKSDIVALSFSAAFGPAAMVEGLAELRVKLPRSVEIWAGGRCAVLHRRAPPHVHTFKALSAIAPALEQWRSAAKPA